MQGGSVTLWGLPHSRRRSRSQSSRAEQPWHGTDSSGTDTPSNHERGKATWGATKNLTEARVGTWRGSCCSPSFRSALARASSAALRCARCSISVAPCDRGAARRVGVPRTDRSIPRNFQPVSSWADAPDLRDVERDLRGAISDKSSLANRAATAGDHRRPPLLLLPTLNPPYLALPLRRGRNSMVQRCVGVCYVQA